MTIDANQIVTIQEYFKIKFARFILKSASPSSEANHGHQNERRVVAHPVGDVAMRHSWRFHWHRIHHMDASMRRWHAIALLVLFVVICWVSAQCAPPVSDCDGKPCRVATTWP